MVLALVAFVACGSTTDLPRVSPVTAHLQGRAYGDPQACRVLPDEQERQICVGLAALELARDGESDAAAQACEGLPAGVWQDECFFLTVDGLGLTGAEAKQACHRAGQFRLKCVGHAIGREGATILGSMQPGEESAALRSLQAMTATYVGAKQASERTTNMMVDHLLAGWTGGLFALEVCGSVPEEVCVRVYQERVKRLSLATGRPWRAACARGVSRARAEATSQPLWADDAAAIVAKAWADLCRRGRVRP